MFLRLNLDKVKHPIHCYYPKDKKEYFDKLRYSTIYYENIEIIEHPIDSEGLVHEDETFKVYAHFMNHGTTCLGYRVEEHNKLKLDKEKLKSHHIKGLKTKELLEKKQVEVEGKQVNIEDVSYTQKGKAIAVVLDTLPNKNITKLAHTADIFLCESTFTQKHKEIAKKVFAHDSTRCCKPCKRCKRKKAHFNSL